MVWLSRIFAAVFHLQGNCYFIHRDMWKSIQNQETIESVVKYLGAEDYCDYKKSGSFIQEVTDFDKDSTKNGDYVPINSLVEKVYSIFVDQKGRFDDPKKLLSILRESQNTFEEFSGWYK